MKKKHPKSLILRLAVFAFAVYAAVTLIHLQVRIGSSKAALRNLTAQVGEQQAKNAEIQRLLTENDNQYEESIARDKLGYAKPDERIYINVTGS